MDFNLAPKMPTINEVLSAFTQLRPQLADLNPAIVVYHLDAELSDTGTELYFIEINTGARAFRISEVDPELGERITTWPTRDAVQAFLTCELMTLVKMAGVPVLFRECTDQLSAR